MAALREIQKQLDNLKNPRSPSEVSEFLQLRRQCMFLEFDTCLRHCISERVLEWSATAQRPKTPRHGVSKDGNSKDRKADALAFLRPKECTTFAFQALMENLACAMRPLSNHQLPSVYASDFLLVPEPFQPRDVKAIQLFPWRSAVSANGPFPSMYWPWKQIEYNLQLSMASLKDVEKCAPSLINTLHLFLFFGLH